ncbi:MAG TPA: SDR family oxidoreductase [Candidatus Limnocylindria bacterium]|jgi:NAD(P)-dependent dehydrogenase (short-subunit alcohol dehydrogenase family)|nr:SDR family oxidoreductase [Candidatus Limnocylindria bacterium]
MDYNQTKHGTGRLAGKVVVVVGGTSGLGLSAVRAALRESAKVVAVGRNREKLGLVEAEMGHGGAIHEGDAMLPGTVESAIELAKTRFGGFDALYHVAGGSGRRQGDGPLHELTDEGWRYTMELNLQSAFFSSRAATREFWTAKRPGSVVLCGSVLGFSPSPRFFSTHGYAAAKAAIIGLVKASAAYYASYGIRFNVLAPALVATPMSERAQGNVEILEFIRTKQPLDGGRIGQPEDLDGAVVWLLGEESRFVTGQVVTVDGGWTVSEGQLPEVSPV